MIPGSCRLLARSVKSIHINCPACGAGAKAPDQAAGRKAKCPKCGALIPIPSSSVDATSSVADSPPHPTTGPGPGQIDRESRPRVRMPLIPTYAGPSSGRVDRGSGLGLLPSPPVRNGTGNTSYLRCKICDKGELLRTKKFRMSGAVVAIGFLLLFPSILGILFSILVFFSAGTADSGVAGAAVAGTSVCFGISSFIGGLLGWLLVMRKKVLQCDSCGAVIAAS